MAQRDYVRKESKSKKNGSRVIPNIMMAIAIILVILFVAILYVVSTNKSKPVAQAPKVTEKPQTTLPEKPEERWTYLKELENPNGTQHTTSQTDNDKLATQEKERQQILDSFANEKPVAPQSTSSNNASPNAQTEKKSQSNSSTSATTPSSQTLGSVWLQCGAFKDKSNAESLKAKLAMVGLASSIKTEKFHRVMAGPYKTKAEAEASLTQLKNSGISSCIVATK